jgi:hypothetical protein
LKTKHDVSDLSPMHARSYLVLSWASGYPTLHCSMAWREPVHRAGGHDSLLMRFDHLRYFLPLGLSPQLLAILV